MAFQCVLVTPEQQLLDESVVQAIVPAHDGLVGILTDRAPLLVKLGTGPLRVDLAGGQRRYFFVDGGVAQMKDNKLTILSTAASPASEVDAEAARAEYAEAAARRATDAKSAEAKEHALARARAKQRVAGMK
jgi:F-type H+-transporting ATPase subunit epsilon